MSSAHDEIVDRMVGSLLECDAQDTATFSELDGSVANEQMSEVQDRYLPLESYAATTGSVRAYTPGRSRSVIVPLPYYWTVGLLWVDYAHLDIHRTSTDRIYHRNRFNSDPARGTRLSPYPVGDRADR